MGKWRCVGEVRVRWPGEAKVRWLVLGGRHRVLCCVVDCECSPALHTKTSMGPRSLSMPAIVDSTCLASVTSQVRYATEPEKRSTD